VFYIGINDYCEVTGIPFDGNLIMFNTYFNRYIQDIFKENINDTCCMKVGCEMIKNMIDKDVLSDDYLQGILDKYNEQKRLYHHAYSEYAREKQKWVREIFFFKGKLQDVLNNETIKQEFIEYLEKKNKLKCFPEVFKNSYDIPSERVKFLKNNPNEMVYWLIMFKDMKVRELTLLKPIDPPIPKILNINYCLLTQLSSMRKRLVDKNVSYFTMKITFTCNKECPNRLTYIDPRTKHARTLTRYICPLKQSPRCADIED
jgi:HD superfamily phosphohydrolase